MLLVFGYTVVIVLGIAIYSTLITEDDEKLSRPQKIAVAAEIAAVIILLAVLIKNTPKQEATPTPPTEMPTATATLTPTPTLTNTPTPTSTPSPTPTTIPTPTPVQARGNAFKPYTDWNNYNVKGSQQYKLQKVAMTDEDGIRIVQDPNGEWRYCVALGTAWAGGHPEHIGRCVDILMESGVVLKCVLADVKKTEHTQDKKNRYGLNGELIEFIISEYSVCQKVRTTGNVSYAKEEFAGRAAGVWALDLWIDGFGKEAKQ